MKILVVDDEKVLVKGIKFNLESEGYQVEAGYDGEEAVELARNGAFDLIISGNIRFADLHFGHIIFHYLFLDLYSILHGECDAFRSGISIGRLGFCQGVRFSYNQFFDDVRLLGGCPFLNNSPVFIRQL